MNTMNNILRVNLFVFLIVWSSVSCALSPETLTRGSAPDPEKGWFIPGHDIKVYKFLYEGEALGAYVGSANESTYYALYSDPIVRIREWDLLEPARQETGSWPLTRWQHLERPSEILNALQNYSHEFSVWREKVEYTSHNPHTGCLNNAPLRYGDIDGDGVSELVLFLNGELIIFSIDQKQIVFSAFIDASDWLRENWEMGKSDDSKTYRHFSAMLAVNGITGQAHRAYTKIYFGDFDEDDNPDILTWEKVYASNTIEEPAGFHQVAERWHHFERDLDKQEGEASGTTDEYLPQPTSTEDIQAWLADNSLTWQQGYPSLSECPGEEGELIPEMHDPLLNDPDVSPVSE